MTKLNYFGNSGKFSITELSKDQVAKLVELLRDKKHDDTVMSMLLDLEDDIEIMNILSAEKEVPF